MAQFPVSDDQGILDGLNYVLSGPVSLGQNFTGFSSSDLYDLTAAYRPPFAIKNPTTSGLPVVKTYVAPIALSTSEMLGPRHIKITFATPQSDPPFANGQGCVVSGVADSWYDGTYYIPGVVECTTTYLVLQLANEYALRPASTGGTVSFTIVDYGAVSTDCNGKVTVTSATDRVFVTAQLNNKMLIDSAVLGNVDYIVQLNRYRGYPNNNPTNPDYIFQFESTLASKTVNLDNSAGTVNQFDIETLFSSILDQPDSGYYWYIVELNYVANGSPLQIDACQLSLRSFTAQVVKA